MRALPWFLCGGLAVAIAFLLVPDRKQSEAVTPAPVEDQVLLARIARLEIELRHLRAALEREGNERQPLVDPVPEGVDLRALAEALLEIEDQRKAEALNASTDQELLDLGRRALREDPEAARVALELLLERAPDGAARTQALTLLGQVHRKSGELFEAEQRLSEAATLAAGTEDGAWASYLWAMTVSDQGDDARALEIAGTIGEVQGLGDWVRRHGEWATAVLSEANGDFAGARARYERLVDECADDEEFAWLVDDLNGRLEKLR